MNTIGKQRYTSTVSRSDKKYQKRICFNKKSFTSMFLSAALLLTSVDCMHVRAEEMADQVPPALTEETLELENQDTVSGNALADEEETAGPDYVKTETGAVIITSFVPLNVKESRLLLDKAEGRLPLEEVAKLLPTELKAYATVYVSENPETEDGKQPGTETGEDQQPTEEEQPGTEAGDGQQPTEGEQPGTEEGESQQPAEGEQPGTETGEGQQPAEGEQPGTEEGESQQPAEGEQPGTEEGDGQQPTEGEQPGTETGEGQQPAEGEQPGTETGEGQQPTEGEQPGTEAGEGQPSTEETQSATGQGQSGAEESQSVTGGEESAANDVAMAEPNRSFAAEAGHQWRLLVAAEASADVADESENNEAKANEGGSDDSANNGSTDDGTNGGGHADDGENSGGAGENGSPDGNVGNGENGGTGERGNADGSTSDGVTGADESGSVDGSTNNGETGTDESGSVDGNTNNDGTGTADTIGAGEDKHVLSTKEVDVEIPVQWVCEDDYENTELTEYTFRPTWDKTAWFYEPDETADSVPVITVSYVDIIKEEVSTQEELAAAFAAGVNKITLKKDIALTATLRLPATADIELDGQGHSLLRGKDENEPFIDTMISMDGEDYTEETYGTLTLKSITVDGKTSADRAGAPVILDCGSLVLEEDAVVRDNYNYGTYPSDEEDAEKVLDYGGGIQVYGELSVTEESLVTGNFADEFGGGVYLADGATLYLYADVIRGNSVSEHAGYGADLYAAGGSTIYYDSSVDMERDGFYLCDGVILICMQGQDAVSIAEPEPQKNVEIYISAPKKSVYNEAFLEELTKELEGRTTEDRKYTVIPTNAEVDISDLRDWYVYDHYDTAYWGSSASETDKDGNKVPPKWLNDSKYGNNSRRKYYSYTENDYYRPASLNENGELVYDLVYTIADWLLCRDLKYKSGGYQLAQFKEHIYNPEGSTDMTFVGYGSGNYVDFMFYDPQSKGEKIVDFKIDSKQVITHALAGMGFLVNTGVKDGKLYGYLVYYHYKTDNTSPGDDPTNLYVCKLNGVNIETLHGSEQDLKSLFGYGASSPNVSGLNALGIEIVRSVDIPSEPEIPNWNSEMKIRIKVSPTEIEIWQQPESEKASIYNTTSVIVKDLEDLGCNGFGPLVAYASTSTGHNCSLASCFTYTDLHMYYTNPTEGNQSMLQPLELADYTQKNTQKYFLNLFGTDESLGYDNTGVQAQLYQDFLKLMQVEGVALITDRDTRFEDYLGNSGEVGSNLCEIEEHSLSVKDLADRIVAFIDGRQTQTTEMQYKLPPDGSEEEGGLQNATPHRAVGNIWLESAADGQVREVKEEQLTGGGYEIQVWDNIAYYYEDDEDRDQYTVTYEVIDLNGDTVHSFTRNAADSGVPSFVVGTDRSKWFTGRYTVKQSITGPDSQSAVVCGYAYFDVKRKAAESHSHTWTEWTTEQEASCTTPGSEVRSCTYNGCYETQRREIGALGHKPKTEWSKDATDHWHECGVCNEKLDSAPHTWSEYTIELEPGCTTEGRKTRFCSECLKTEEEAIPANEHSLKAGWSTNETEHWHECEICNEKFDIDDHQSAEWSINETGHWRVCEICDETFDTGSHTWGEYTIEQEADCTTEGSKTRLCTICGKTETEVIPANGHSIKAEWSTNETDHWHDCENCDETFSVAKHQSKEWSANSLEHWYECGICTKKYDVGFHKFGPWVTEEEATEDKDGSKYRACTDCGYRERDSIIRGKITKREDCGGNAPQTEISTELPALALAVLAEDDVHAVGNGTDITIVLTVEDADSTVSAADRAAVTSTIKSYKLGQYFDMSLFKEMNGGKSQVTETSDEIRLSIEVPGQFRKTARKYAIVRVHNGEAVLLKDLDAEDSTVTIDTDRFSIYAFVYTDRTKASESSKPVSIEEKPYPEQAESEYIVAINYQNQKEAVPESQKDSEPRTGETTHFELYATVAFINGASYLYFLFGGRHGMTEETKTELVSRLIRWAKQGGKLRRWLALAVIFLLLVYYHSIGKQVGVKWRQVCGE